MRNVVTTGILVSLALFTACERSHRPPVASDRTATQAGSTSVPDEAYAPTGITARAEPTRLLVRQAVWRSAPDVLLVDGSDPRVRQLHKLLASNQRVEYTCGYHWAFDFEYAPGVVESILINEQCESFKEQGKLTWTLLSEFFTAADKKPTHHMVVAVVRDRKDKAAIEQNLDRRFDAVLNTDKGGPSLIIVSKQPWSDEKVKELRSLHGIEKVDTIPVQRFQ